MPEDEAALLAFVRDRDVPCPSCKYNLRQLAAPRCPECGEALVLQVGRGEPKLALWLATGVPLFLAGGIGLFVAIVWLKEGLRSYNGRDLTLGSMYIASAAAACVALWFRRRMMRLPLGWRRTLAATSMAYVAFVFLWTLSLIFRF